VLSWKTTSKEKRLEKKEKNISKKGSEDKADNVTQRLEGFKDTDTVQW
jgi:hypothetical protein